MTAIGIDLGTTFSCVAALKNRQVRVFQNDQGRNITPSVVAFSGEDILIGEPAKKHMQKDEKNTVYSVKRIIGRSFNDRSVQEDLSNWPFRVVQDCDGRPKIEVLHKNERTSFYVEEISAMVLREMKRIAEQSLGEKVHNAVVTVPAYFNHTQRAATIAAAKIAGLHVLRIINEPTAAAIACGLLRKTSPRKTVLVYDLGGGTFDATVLTIQGRDFDVKATTGDPHLGGDDFDNRLVEHYVKQIRRKYGSNITGRARAMRRLRKACVEVKEELSFSENETVLLEELFNGITFEDDLGRSKFTDLNRDYFDRTIILAKNALKDAKLSIEEVDFVVLAGGSTRIPYVKQKMEDLFGAHKIQQPMNPDEIVGYGAAAYAAHLIGITIPEIGAVDLTDITALSLGIELVDKTTSVLIKRNANIPAKETLPYQTVQDYQKTASIKVCQGESRLFAQNHFLDEFKLPVTPRLKGETKLDVCFNIDVDGILTVTAWETGVGDTRGINIDLRGKLDELDVEQMREKWEEYRKYHTEEADRYKLSRELESLVNSVKTKCTITMVKEKCDDIMEWLRNNPKASPVDIRRKQMDFQAFYEAKR